MKSDDEQRYLVSDVGATFGKTGSSISRSKSNLKEYEDSKFIEKETTADVDFTMHSRPFVLTAVNRSQLRKAHQDGKCDQTYSLPQMRNGWASCLDKLSDEQIRDCFRAAATLPMKWKGTAKEVQKRITALQRVVSVS